MISLAGVVLLHLLISQVLKPMITQWTLQPLDISSFEVLRGNVSALLGGLVVVWTVAAFGEELVVAGVHVVDGRKTSMLTGTAPAYDAPEQGAVLAVLDATNRFFQGKHG